MFHLGLGLGAITIYTAPFWLAGLLFILTLALVQRGKRKKRQAPEGKWGTIDPVTGRKRTPPV